MIKSGHAFCKDEFGRSLILRGVNLAGSSKVPYRPDGATFRREGFFDHRNVSFIGRPFPLDEADEHFARLRAWGLTFERLVLPWEALEHAGPGIYDREFLDYLYEVCRKAGEHGISLFIDPHEDLWARFCGGDGAPGWTLEAAGLDMTVFKASGAAVTHQEYDGVLPPMLWPTNHHKLAAASMFTLFFAGNTFAPQTKVDGVPIQDYLQDHFIRAFVEVARRLKDLPNVTGFDTLNEPGTGYIGRPDISAVPPGFKIGPIPTPYQGMLLGAGIPQEVDVWDFPPSGPVRTGSTLLNPDGVRAWLPGHECIWREHGVWDLGPDGQPVLLHADYFHQVDGKTIDFNSGHIKPFANRFAAALHAVEPRFLIFLETNRRQPLPEWGPQDAKNIVSAPHWYDGTVLYTKKFDPDLGSDLHGGDLIHGEKVIREAYAEQLRGFQQKARERLGGAPTIFGEVGIPYDMDGKRPLRTGDTSMLIQAMDRSLRAMDDALASYTIWCYTPDNDNEHGDLWNDEDLSLFSRNQQTDPADIHSGGRALEAVVRPYARATAGEPLRMSFEVHDRSFTFEFRHDLACSAPTEIFLPSYQYPQGCQVTVSDGRYEIDPATQTLRYFHSDEKDVHQIQIRPA